MENCTISLLTPDELNNLFHNPEYVDIRRHLKGRLLDVMAESEDRTAAPASGLVALWPSLQLNCRQTNCNHRDVLDGEFHK